MPHHNFTSETEIHRIGLGLIDRSLPKSDWTHAAHFAAALWLMRYRPELEASACMPDFIRAYNEATGVANTDTDGYHETITQASLRAARAELDRYSASTPIFEIANALMASPILVPPDQSGAARPARCRATAGETPRRVRVRRVSRVAKTKASARAPPTPDISSWR